MRRRTNLIGDFIFFFRNQKVEMSKLLDLYYQKSKEFDNLYK
jgi:hypothetical protein